MTNIELTLEKKNLQTFILIIAASRAILLNDLGEVIKCPDSSFKK